MRKFWIALLFLTGLCAHEVRNPTQCAAIAASSRREPRRRESS